MKQERRAQAFTEGQFTKVATTISAMAGYLSRQDPDNVIKQPITAEASHTLVAALALSLGFNIHSDTSFHLITLTQNEAENQELPLHRTLIRFDFEFSHG